MSSFQDLGVFVHKNPEAEAQKSYVYALSLTPHTRNSLGFYLRVIVNDKPLNLEKTTSHVISVTVD